MTRWATRIYPSLLAACLVLAVVGAAAGYADAQPAPKPFTKDDVLTLLKGDVAAKRVEELVRERGIDFQITPQTENELRSAVADKRSGGDSERVGLKDCRFPAGISSYAYHQFERRPCARLRG